METKNTLTYKKLKDLLLELTLKPFEDIDNLPVVYMVDEEDGVMKDLVLTRQFRRALAREVNHQKKEEEQIKPKSNAEYTQSLKDKLNKNL